MPAPAAAPPRAAACALALHDALPISGRRLDLKPGEDLALLGGEPGRLLDLTGGAGERDEVEALELATEVAPGVARLALAGSDEQQRRSGAHTSELQSPCKLVCRLLLLRPLAPPPARLPYTTLFRSRGGGSI